MESNYTSQTNDYNINMYYQNDCSSYYYPLQSYYANQHFQSTESYYPHTNFYQQNFTTINENVSQEPSRVRINSSPNSTLSTSTTSSNTSSPLINHSSVSNVNTLALDDSNLNLHQSPSNDRLADYGFRTNYAYSPIELSHATQLGSESGNILRH
jgi:hypothetical protein